MSHIVFAIKSYIDQLRVQDYLSKNQESSL